MENLTLWRKADYTLSLVLAHQVDIPLLFTIPAVTGFAFGRAEGRQRKVFDAIRWDIERIKTLLSLGFVSISGQESLARDLQDIQTEVALVLKVRGAKRDERKALKAVMQEIGEIKRNLTI
jgi:hypothetical protein